MTQIVKMLPTTLLDHHCRALPVMPVMLAMLMMLVDASACDAGNADDAAKVMAIIFARDMRDAGVCVGLRNVHAKLVFAANDAPATSMPKFAHL